MDMAIGHMLPAAVALFTAFSTGCAASIPSGWAGVLVTSRGVQPGVLGEGIDGIGVLSHVDAFNLQNQQETEDLAAIAADGAPLAVRASTIGYHLARGELPALDREVGPDYYVKVLDPIVRSTVRRVLAQYASFEIDSDVIKRAQDEITAIAARRARPFHILVDMVDIRSLAVVLSRKSYAVVVDASVIQQEVETEPQKMAIERQRADQRRIEARGIAAANGEVADTLTPEVLADRAVRAWGALLAASRVVIVPDSSSPIVEEAP
jgi:hypothetical protein